MARQIAEALEAAHEQGIIHRDLKPANVKVKGRRHGRWQVSVAGGREPVWPDGRELFFVGEGPPSSGPRRSRRS